MEELIYESYFENNKDSFVRKITFNPYDNCSDEKIFVHTQLRSEDGLLDSIIYSVSNGTIMAVDYMFLRELHGRYFIENKRTESNFKITINKISESVYIEKIYQIK